jgi:hypothetical protein
VRSGEGIVSAVLEQSGAREAPGGYEALRDTGGDRGRPRVGQSPQRAGVLGVSTGEYAATNPLDGIAACPAGHVRALCRPAALEEVTPAIGLGRGMVVMHDLSIPRALTLIEGSQGHCSSFLSRFMAGILLASSLCASKKICHSCACRIIFAAATRETFECQTALT